ncbi:hypothetical protein CSB37_01410 [bacterium DOLZORAL124_38_8]|nr:MAG: hypothetical protein CSB37_01410 [bacterium DOLZORAL124_38_8]
MPFFKKSAPDLFKQGEENFVKGTKEELLSKNQEFIRAEFSRRGIKKGDPIYEALIVKSPDEVSAEEKFDALIERFNHLPEEYQEKVTAEASTFLEDDFHIRAQELLSYFNGMRRLMYIALLIGIAGLIPQFFSQLEDEGVKIATYLLLGLIEGILEINRRMGKERFQNLVEYFTNEVNLRTDVLREFGVSSEEELPVSFADMYENVPEKISQFEANFNNGTFKNDMRNVRAAFASFVKKEE